MNVIKKPEQARALAIGYAAKYCEVSEAMRCPARYSYAFSLNVPRRTRIGKRVVCSFVVLDTWLERCRRSASCTGSSS